MKASNEIIDLREKDRGYKASFQEWDKKDGPEQESLDENTELGLKRGDVVEFWSGYNGDIRYRTEILGFNKVGKAYMLWDCYWSPVDLSARDFTKVTV